MSFMQALFAHECDAAIASRDAYLARRRAEEVEAGVRCQTDNAAVMAALSAVSRCRTAADQTADAYRKARDDLNRAWDAYSRLLAPWPLRTDADACCDLSNADAADLVDVLIAAGVVADPHGWNRVGQIDPKKFVAWFLRRALDLAVIEGLDA